MNSAIEDIYLQQEVLDKMEKACEKLDVSKSLFLNILLKELFQKADPEDIFYNRVEVCYPVKSIKTNFDNKKTVTQ